MEAKAVARYIRVTPRKARFVLDTVRGKSVKEALATLKFVPNEAARYIERVIESAAANAENNFSMDRDILRIDRAFVDVGPMLKRIHPRAMGRAFRILKRTAHITVVVGEDDSLRKAPVKAKGRRRTQTARTPVASKPAAKKTAGAAKPAASSEANAASEAKQD
jgi:large subunit ribosomal protein L22